MESPADILKAGTFFHICNLQFSSGASEFFLNKIFIYYLYLLLTIIKKIKESTEFYILHTPFLNLISVKLGILATVRYFQSEIKDSRDEG